jgi:hypothetical protein
MKVVIKEGDRFGYRQVIRRDGSTPKSKASQWLVNCTGGGPECKGIHLASAPSLNSNDSCGCLKGARISRANTRHGYSGEPAYKHLISARNRCEHRKEYLDRGIVVAREWKGEKGVINCMKSKGRTYKPGLRLHRVDPWGPYSDANTVWATRSLDQAQTTRSLPKDVVLAIRKDKRIRRVIAADYHTSVQTVQRIQKKETYNVYP